MVKNAGERKSIQNEERRVFFPKGLRLWISARYATALSSVSRLWTCMWASISHDPQLLSHPHSQCGPVLSPDNYFSCCLLWPVATPHLLPPVYNSVLVPPCNLTLLLVLLFSKPKHSKWLSFITMKTDNVFFFFLFYCFHTPICLPRKSVKVKSLPRYNIFATYLLSFMKLCFYICSKISLCFGQTLKLTLWAIT